jgi:hypothetical protein
MTHAQLHTAIHEGIPFVINMADGKSYRVENRDAIALGKTAVVVIEDDLAHWLPLLTMTGVTYARNGARKE